jgi:hypothetical protein
MAGFNPGKSIKKSAYVWMSSIYVRQPSVITILENREEMRIYNMV